VSFKDAKQASTLCVVQVKHTARVTPNMMRVTLHGDQFEPLQDHGHDHWFRLFLPQEDGTTSFDLPERFDMRSYIRYLRMPSASRPHMRNYTVREFRPDARELDIDFVVHGDEGVATRWVQRAQPGDTVALIDQGRGYEYDADTDAHLLVGDETALPAIVGILRDLPRDARGTALIEVPHAEDAQPTAAPDGVDVRWIAREPGMRVGATALDAFAALPVPSGEVSAYCVGEQALATGARRHLVASGVPKQQITFVGYWKAGKGH
jgi:NADPH-dependent ferric siderophore reductase